MYYFLLHCYFGKKGIILHFNSLAKGVNSSNHQKHLIICAGTVVQGFMSRAAGSFPENRKISRLDPMLVNFVVNIASYKRIMIKLKLY